MGYIFDALNRNPGDSAPERPERSDPIVPLAADLPPVGSDPIIPPSDVVSGDEPSGPGLPSFTPPDLNAQGMDDRLVTLGEPMCVAAEEYRSIRTGILARWQNRRHLIHTITSATPQEGKTITSLNLGFTFAELHNRSTVVLEADLRLPQFSRLLNLQEGPGLIELLKGETDLASATRVVGHNRLHVVPAGRRPCDNAVQLLSGNTTINLLKTLRQRYDHVIIDTPPVIELADAGVLGAISDGVFLIVRMGRTPRTLVDQAVRTLNSYNASVAGIIATDNRRHRRRYYHYRYGYRYQSRYYDKAA